MDLIQQLRALSIASKRRRTPIFIHGSSERQDKLAFPKFIIDYIIKNPSSPKLWKKLIQTCKLFFDKNPIVVLPCLHFDADYDIHGWKTCSAGYCNHQHDQSLGEIRLFKLWITETLDIRDGWVMNGLFPDIFKCGADINGLLPHIFQCDAKEIVLFNQALTFEDFKFLSSEVTDVILAACIRDSDGKIVKLEKLVENMPKILGLTYFFKPDGIDITRDTVKKLAETEHLKNCYRITLHHIPPSLDFDALSKFILENKHIWFVLTFQDQTTTEEYMVKVKAFAKKVKQEDGYTCGCRRPKICYNNVNLVDANEEENGEEEDDDQNDP